MPGDTGSESGTPFLESPVIEDSQPSTYPVVALGGTFDHLHAGHKILVSMGAWIAEEKLIVGVTGGHSSLSFDDARIADPKGLLV